MKLLTKIILKAIIDNNYLKLYKDPDNHKSLSLIKKLALYKDLYMCEFSDFYLFINKSYKDIQNLIQNYSISFKLIKIDPELND